jgi:hypothetical protein
VARYHIDSGVCNGNFTGEVAATLATLRGIFRLLQTFVKSYIKNPATNSKRGFMVSKVSKHEFYAQKPFLYIRGYLVFFVLFSWYPSLVMEKKVKKAKVSRETKHNNVLAFPVTVINQW